MVSKMYDRRPRPSMKRKIALPDWTASLFFALDLSMLGLSVPGRRPAGLGGYSGSTLTGGARAGFVVRLTDFLRPHD